MPKLTGVMPIGVLQHICKFWLSILKTEVMVTVFGVHTVIGTSNFLFLVTIFDMILLKKGPIKIAQTFREFLPIGKKKICF